jgi:hypothetical protein
MCLALLLLLLFQLLLLPWLVSTVAVLYMPSCAAVWVCCWCLLIAARHALLLRKLIENSIREAEFTIVFHSSSTART